VKRRRVKTAMRLQIAILAACFLALMVSVQWIGWRTQGHLSIASNTLFPATLRAQEATAAFQRFTKTYSNAVMTEDRNAASTAAQPEQDVVKALNAIEALGEDLGPERQREVRGIESDFQGLSIRSRDVYSRIIGNASASDQNWAEVGELGKNNQKIEASLRRLSSSLADDFQAELGGVKFWTRIQRAFGFILCALVAASVISIFKTLENRVSEPLESLMIRFKEIAGDLAGEAAEDLSRDEIGELDHYFTSLVSHLKEMAEVTARIAEGDLSLEIRPRSEHDDLGKALAQMAVGLSALVTTVRDGATQVASSSEQMAAAADESAKVSVQASAAIETVSSTMEEMNVNVQSVVQGMQKQASNVGETSASISQMVASIQRVAQTTGQLLEISERSRREADAGLVSMSKSTESLNKISNSIQSSAEIISALKERAVDIGRIVEVIDDIAEQTNLLALNAAIEAARAGEHGLGFAVVADEVRKLAEKSAQSTQEIGDLIGRIQDESNKAVGNMDKSIAIVDEGLAFGTDLNSVLTKISAVVTEVYRFAEEIRIATREQADSSSQIDIATHRLNAISCEVSAAVNEQATGTSAVVSSMERMSGLVQQSSSSSVELAAQSEQMSGMSRTLLDLMGRFKLKNGASPRRSELKPATAISSLPRVKPFRRNQELVGK
jgi:methyl-accepting chemotaxis protein